MHDTESVRALADRIDRLLRAARIRDARDLLERSGLPPQSADFRLLACLVLRAAGDDARTLAAVRTDRARFPAVWQFVELELSLLVRGGDADAIDACLRDLHASRAPPGIAAERHAAVLEQRGEVGAAVRLLEEAVADGRAPLTPGIASRLADGCHRLDRHADSVAWIERALERDPHAACSGAQVAGALAGAYPADHGLARIAALRGRYPEHPDLYEAHATLLLLVGRIDRLEALLAQPPATEDSRRDRWSRMAMAAALDHLFPREAAAAAEAARARVVHRERRHPARREVLEGFARGRHWAHARGTAPAGTVIGFTGGNAHFGVTVHEFDHALAGLGLDALYLRDPARQYFFRGIDGVADSFAGIAAFVDSLDLARPLYCVGSSGGTLAAMDVGRRVAPAAVLLFGPLTFLPERYDDVPDYDRDWRAIHRYIRATYADRILDYAAEFRAAPPAWPLHLVCGSDDVESSHHVRRMAGVSNARVLDVPGAGHAVARVLEQRDELQAVLAARLVAPA